MQPLARDTETEEGLATDTHGQKQTFHRPLPSLTRDAENAEKYPAQNQHWKPKQQNQTSLLLLLPLPVPRAVALVLLRRTF